MKNKTLEFVKNTLIAAVPFICGGVAGGRLADLVTDSDVAITAASTVSAYVTGYTAFAGLHAFDNKERYRVNGSWRKKEVFLDASRMFFSLAAAEVAYAIGRSSLMDYLLHKDLSVTESSIWADVVAFPLYLLVAIPLAKKLKFIRQDKNQLEDITK